MVVGVCRVRLLLSGSLSLKDKRAVVRSVKDKVQARLHVTVSEVSDQDLWQSAGLGFAVVSADHAVAESLVDRVLELIEAEAKVIADDRDFIHYGEGAPLSEGGYAHWEPEQDGPPLGTSSLSPSKPSKPSMIAARPSGRAGLRVGGHLRRGKKR